MPPVKPTTAQGYRHDIEYYVLPHIGELRLQAVRPATISSMYWHLSEQGGRGGRPLAPSTVVHVHRTLRKALNDAVHVERLLPVNPADRAKRPRAARREVGGLWTTDQLRAFLQAARQHRLYAFYRLAAYSGARRGELLALRWPDVDLDAAEVTIGASAFHRRPQAGRGHTKGDRSRIVSIDAGTVTVLRDHRKRQAAEQLAAGPLWEGADLVFATETGRPLYPDTVSNLMSRFCADLPHARLHDLRHLHATDPAAQRRTGARGRRAARACRSRDHAAGVGARPTGAGRWWGRCVRRRGGRRLSASGGGPARAGTSALRILETHQSADVRMVGGIRSSVRLCAR
ncbi:MAG TPA: tyrosine-type recombinase/integrase [Nocardioidaceae bacterium]|nr:tyrosine-type recombinase/integrase [Nocardioidaceae bacterium]